MSRIEIGVALASRQIDVMIGDQRVTLSPEQATKLENRLHDAVDQIDGRALPVSQCTWRSDSADDGYCRCVKPAGHDGVHECLHGLDHNATSPK